jgi:hypothetical protein
MKYVKSLVDVTKQTLNAIDTRTIVIEEIRQVAALRSGDRDVMLAGAALRATAARPLLLELVVISSNAQPSSSCGGLRRG